MSLDQHEQFVKQTSCWRSLQHLGNTQKAAMASKLGFSDDPMTR
jgi:hypothetical protein